MFIIHCQEDQKICLIKNNLDVIYDPRTVKINDTVAFLFGGKRYTGKLIDLSDDEKYITERYESLIRKKPLNGNDKSAHNQVCEEQVSSRKGRLSRATTEPRSNKNTDSGSNNTARKYNRTKETNDTEAVKVKREEIRQYAENLKKAHDSSIQHTESLILSNLQTMDCGTQIIPSTSTSQFEANEVESLMEINVDSYVETQSKKPAQNSEVPKRGESAQVKQLGPGVNQKQSDESEGDTSEGESSEIIENPKKKRRIDDEDEEEQGESRVNLKEIENQLRELDNDQLLGENYPHAQGAENARQCGRRLLGGVFHRDALLKYSIGGEQNNNSRKDCLNRVAIQAIIDLVLEIQDKKIREALSRKNSKRGSKKTSRKGSKRNNEWSEQLSKADILAAMRQKLAELPAAQKKS